MKEFIKLFEPGELTAEQEQSLYALAEEFELTVEDVIEYQNKQKGE